MLYLSKWAPFFLPPALSSLRKLRADVPPVLGTWIMRTTVAIPTVLGSSAAAIPTSSAEGGCRRLRAEVGREGDGEGKAEGSSPAALLPLMAPLSAASTSTSVRAPIINKFHTVALCAVPGARCRTACSVIPGERERGREYVQTLEVTGNSVQGYAAAPRQKPPRSEANTNTH